MFQDQEFKGKKKEFVYRLDNFILKAVKNDIERLAL